MPKPSKMPKPCKMPKLIKNVAIGVPKNMPDAQIKIVSLPKSNEREVVVFENFKRGSGRPKLIKKI